MGVDSITKKGKSLEDKITMKNLFCKILVWPYVETLYSENDIETFSCKVRSKDTRALILFIVQMFAVEVGFLL